MNPAPSLDSNIFMIELIALIKEIIFNKGEGAG